MSDTLLTPSEFEAALRKIGEERYHHRHPFNLRMHEGTLTRSEVQSWVRNRYYYQTRIPIKDGMILTKSPDASFRRDWLQRIVDHDGQKPGEGGLELWLRLAEAVGLDRDDVEALHGIFPGVRRACDAYVEFVESHDLLESVAASLTELFAGDIMVVRIAAFEAHYDWVDPEGLAYFQSRTVQAPRDAQQGLRFVCEHATTPALQRVCLNALERKCEILWSLLDAVERGSAVPGVVRHALRRKDPQTGEDLVVLPERAVKLGGSGAAILELCDGKRSAVQIAEAMKRTHAGEARIADDVHDFLEQMGRLGVVRFDPPRADA